MKTLIYIVQKMMANGGALIFYFNLLNSKWGQIDVFTLLGGKLKILSKEIEVCPIINENCFDCKK